MNARFKARTAVKLTVLDRVTRTFKVKYLFAQYCDARCDDGSVWERYFLLAHTRHTGACAATYASPIRNDLCKVYVFPKEGCRTAYALHGTARGVWGGVLNASPSPTHDPRQFGTHHTKTHHTAPHRTTWTHRAHAPQVSPTACVPPWVRRPV